MLGKLIKRVPKSVKFAFMALVVFLLYRGLQSFYENFELTPTYTDEVNTQLDSARLYVWVKRDSLIEVLSELQNQNENVFEYNETDSFSISVENYPDSIIINSPKMKTFERLFRNSVPGNKGILKYEISDIQNGDSAIFVNIEAEVLFSLFQALY